MDVGTPYQEVIKVLSANKSRIPIYFSLFAATAFSLSLYP